MQANEAKFLNMFMYGNISYRGDYVALAQISNRPCINIFKKSTHFPKDDKTTLTEKPHLTIGAEDLGECEEICCFRFVEINQILKLFVATNNGFYLICPITNETQTLGKEIEDRIFTDIEERNNAIYVSDIQGLTVKITFITSPLVTPVHRSEIPVSALACHNDMIYVALDDGNTVVIDAKTETQVLVIQEPIWSCYATQMKLVQGTNFLVQGLSNGSVVIIDTENPGKKIIANLHSKEITALSALRKSDAVIQIVTGSEDGVITVSEYYTQHTEFKCVLSKNFFNKVILGIEIFDDKMNVVVYNSKHIISLDLPSS